MASKIKLLSPDLNEIEICFFAIHREKSNLFNRLTVYLMVMLFGNVELHITCRYV